MDPMLKHYLHDLIAAAQDIVSAPERSDLKFWREYRMLTSKMHSLDMALEHLKQHLKREVSE